MDSLTHIIERAWPFQVGRSWTIISMFPFLQDKEQKLIPPNPQQNFNNKKSSFVNAPRNCINSRKWQKPRKKKKIKTYSFAISSPAVACKLSKTCPDINLSGTVLFSKKKIEKADGEIQTQVSFSSNLPLYSLDFLPFWPLAPMPTT